MEKASPSRVFLFPEGLRRPVHGTRVPIVPRLGHWLGVRVLVACLLYGHFLHERARLEVKEEGPIALRTRPPLRLLCVSTHSR
jgi:hypothetical protein